MKATVLGIMAGLLFGGSAMSADLTPYKAPPPPPPAPLAYDWSGVYIGGHIGGGWDTTKFADPDAFSNLVNCSFPALAGGTSLATERYSVDTKWTATSTLTVGLARDRWMFYSKTGFAAAENTYKLNIAGSSFGAPFAFSSSTDDTVVGWTFGTGVKWAFADNWFVNAEYDYLDLGSKAQNLSGTFSATPAGAVNPTATFTPTFRQYISEVKVGLNYKFSPGLLFW
jgi:outer membrane immunogenic protein